MRCGTPTPTRRVPLPGQSFYMKRMFPGFSWRASMPTRSRSRSPPDSLTTGRLAKREACCHLEVRLNRRYAPDLYLGVVPITSDHGTIRVEGSGDPIEYAVKMQRFPEDALLSQRLETGKIANEEVFQLAATVADFHQQATRSDPEQPWGSPSIILKEAIDNFHDLRSAFASQPTGCSVAGTPRSASDVDGTGLPTTSIHSGRAPRERLYPRVSW